MEDAVSTTSPEFVEVEKKMEAAVKSIEKLSRQIRPMLHGERYLSGEEVCEYFHLTARTLQNYRDSNSIPYTHLGGKMLYPETELEKLLDRNLVKVLLNG